MGSIRSLRDCEFLRFKQVLAYCREIKGAMSSKRNIENQRETRLQIGTYVGLIMSFLDSNYTENSMCRGYIKRQSI